MKLQNLFFVLAMLLLCIACSSGAGEGSNDEQASDTEQASSVSNDDTQSISDTLAATVSLSQTATVSATLAMDATATAIAKQPTATPTPEPTIAVGNPGEPVFVAIGAQDARISVLKGKDWIRPIVNASFASCVHANSFFDQDTNLWVGCDRLATSTDEGEIWEEVGGLANAAIVDIDPQGLIWFVQETTINVIDPNVKSIANMYAALVSTGEEAFPVQSIAFNPDDGTVWLAGKNDNGSDLVSFDGTTWTAYGEPEDIGLLAYQHPTALTVTSKGVVLVGVNGAVYTFENGSCTPYITDLPIGAINDILERPEGGFVLASATSGIIMWDGASSAIEIHDMDTHGLPSNTITDLAYDTEQRIWAATAYGVVVKNNGDWKVALPYETGLVASDISAIAVKGAPVLPPPDAITKTATVQGQFIFGQLPVPQTKVQLCSEGGALDFRNTPCEDRFFVAETVTDFNGFFVFERVPLGSLGLAVANFDEEWMIVVGSVDVFEEDEIIDLGYIDLAH